MVSENTITVGDFLDPKPDDSLFPNVSDAIEAAKVMAERDPHTAIAVWKGFQLERVMLRGFELEPVVR